MVTPDIGASTIGGQISWDPMRSAGTARFTTPDSTLESSTRQTTSLASDQGVEKGGYTDAQSREFRGFELLATTEYPCGAVPVNDDFFATRIDDQDDCCSGDQKCTNFFLKISAILRRRDDFDREIECAILDLRFCREPMSVQSLPRRKLNVRQIASDIVIGYADVHVRFGGNDTALVPPSMNDRARRHLHELNLRLNRVIVAPLTSAMRPLRFRVTTTVAGRPASVVLDQLRTVDGQRLGKRLGKVDARTMADILRTLQAIFSP